MLKTHSVLGIDCGERPAARWPRDFDETRARAVIQALQYQLQERLPLIKSPDPVAGDLLFDLGNLKALDGKFDHCLVALELAEKYGTLRPARMRLRHYLGQF